MMIVSAVFMLSAGPRSLRDCFARSRERMAFRSPFCCLASIELRALDANTHTALALHCRPCEGPSLERVARTWRHVVKRARRLEPVSLPELTGFAYNPNNSGRHVDVHFSSTT